MNDFSWEHKVEPSVEISDEAALTLGLVILCLGGIIILAEYIMRGVGLMEIAKKRGFDKPWLAWIPFASTYLLGKVADDICYRNGKRRSYRKLLPIFEVATDGLCILPLGAFLVGPVLLTLLGYGNLTVPKEYMEILKAVIAFQFVAIGFAIAYLVFFYIVLYQILKEYMPSTAIVFLLLSILINTIFSAIALLVMRNKVGTTLVAPPGHWENGVYCRRFSHPGNTYIGPNQVGFDPYARKK